MASLPPSRSIPNGSPNRDALWLPAASQFSPAMKLPPFFEENRLIVDAALERLLPAATAQPSSVHTAMRYSVFAGGKRIRPILCLETTRIFVSDVTPSLHPACAIEFIHTYSLIHDDLPALDNDDLRRGKPTCHKKFGEAIAILAGEAEGKSVDPQMLEYIHRSKTAALIRASTTSGALCAGATSEDVARLRRFGETIGWAFQVTDDILDVEESSAALGKTAGKDMAQKKATYPAVYGLERSHQIANDLVTKAIAELAPYAERAARLRDIAEFLVLRRA